MSSALVIVVRPSMSIAAASSSSSAFVCDARSPLSGVATAAFYPSVMLLPTGGLDSRTISSLFDANSLLWSIGVSATQTIFDGGRIRANVD